MKKSDEIMKKKIHSVKSWLEKAEHSYEDDSVTKGKLQLLLAKAEMQYLEESDSPRLKRANLLVVPFMVIAVLLAGGGLYFHQAPEQPRAVVAEESAPFFKPEALGSQKPQWAKALQEETRQVLVITKPVVAVKVVSQKDEPMAEAYKEEVAPVTVEHVKRNVEVLSTKATTSAADIMNAKQIKETVYDAGRSLRGN